LYSRFPDLLASAIATPFFDFGFRIGDSGLKTPRKIAPQRRRERREKQRKKGDLNFTLDFSYSFV
jgi:hypothetical protein